MDSYVDPDEQFLCRSCGKWRQNEDLAKIEEKLYTPSANPFDIMLSASRLISGIRGSEKKKICLACVKRDKKKWILYGVLGLMVLIWAAYKDYIGT